MLLNNKKAVSEVVGYVILIVIAISLSVMVYAFLRLYVPKETISCPADTNLILSDYSCSIQTHMLNVTLENKGLFSVSAAYVRLQDKSSGFKNQTNTNDFLLYNPDNTPSLDPGKSYSSSYNLDSYGFTNISPNGEYTLEIEPALIINKQIVLCENAIITQSISCK